MTHEPIPDSPIAKGAVSMSGMTYSPSEECTQRWEFIRQYNINAALVEMGVDPDEERFA